MLIMRYKPVFLLLQSFFYVFFNPVECSSVGMLLYVTVNVYPDARLIILG